MKSQFEKVGSSEQTTNENNDLHEWNDKVTFPYKLPLADDGDDVCGAVSRWRHASLISELATRVGNIAMCLRARVGE